MSRGSSSVFSLESVKLNVTLILCIKNLESNIVSKYKRIYLSQPHREQNWKYIMKEKLNVTILYKN